MHFLKINDEDEELWRIPEARFLVNYDADTDSVWIYSDNNELQMRKFATNEGEDYKARFYEKPDHQVMQAELHDNNKKLSLKTFNYDLSNPKYNLLTYELCQFLLVR